MADIGFANVEVLSATNTKVLAINNTRVSLEKGYGLMTPIATFEVAVSDILNALDVQPVKHGRWIPKGSDFWLCSNCENNLIYSSSDRDRTEKQRYCSRCGARMEGET